MAKMSPSAAHIPLLRATRRAPRVVLVRSAEEEEKRTRDGGAGSGRARGATGEWTEAGHGAEWTNPRGNGLVDRDGARRTSGRAQGAAGQRTGPGLGERDRRSASVSGSQRSCASEAGGPSGQGRGRSGAGQGQGRGRTRSPTSPGGQPPRARTRAETSAATGATASESRGRSLLAPRRYPWAPGRRGHLWCGRFW